MLALFSCRSDQKEEQEAKLFGKWEMATAYRDAKETTTLNNVYFEFLEDGTMSSNLPINPTGETFSTPFSYKNNQLECTVAGTAYLFDVQSISDTLVMGTSLMNKPFEFVMTRSTVTESGE